MDTKQPTYEELLKKIENIDPHLVDAIDEEDTTLIREFKSLSIDEKISTASESAQALDAIKEK